MRVIAPEKEGMIGGAGLEASGRGLGSACFGTRGSSIRRGAHRGELTHAVTCSSGKGGRPGSSQEADSSDSGAPFREGARSYGGNRISIFESYDAGRSLWGLTQDSRADKVWHVPSSARSSATSLQPRANEGSTECALHSLLFQLQHKQDLRL